MDINIFARRLKECRTNAGLNVRELGECIGVSGANVSRYENAIHGPGRDTLAEMVDLFNVNPAWLMGASSEKYLNKAKICKRIPVTSHIPAGHLDITKENIIDYEYVEETSLIDFCFIVKGDSMINARILDGDLVYVRKQSSVENGEIAVVLIDDEEATLKRFYKLDDSIILRAEHPNHPDKVLTKSSHRLLPIAFRLRSPAFKEVTTIQIIGKAITLKSEIR